MTKRLVKPGDMRIGPYSRALDRGAVGDQIKVTSREGRFLQRVERELLAQLGPDGTATFAQKLLIRRIARTLLRLEILDERLISGVGTDHDERAYNAASNRVRLDLRELGLKGATTKTPTLDDIVARHAKAEADK